MYAKSYVQNLSLFLILFSKESCLFARKVHIVDNMKHYLDKSEVLNSSANLYKILWLIITDFHEWTKHSLQYVDEKAFKK